MGKASTRTIFGTNTASPASMKQHAPMPQSQPSKMRSSPLVMTQNQFTMGRSLCDGRFSGFGGLGACNMMNSSSANSDHGTSKPPYPRGNQESLFSLLSTVCWCLLDTWRVPVFVLGGFCHNFSQNLVTSTWSVWLIWVVLNTGVLSVFLGVFWMACGLLFVDIRNLWKTPRPRGRTIYGGARNGQFNAWEDLRRCIWQSFAKDQAVSDR